MAKAKLVKVPVLLKHIKAGKCCMPEQCAAALAIRDKFKGAARVSVGYMTATVNGKLYFLSKKSSDFVCAVDDRKPDVKPTTLLLYLNSTDALAYGD